MPRIFELNLCAKGVSELSCPQILITCMAGKPTEKIFIWFGTALTVSARRINQCLASVERSTNLVERTHYVSVNSNWVHTPGNPRENVFERANPGHPGNFFCLIPCTWAKNDGRIAGGGAKFSQTRRNCSLSLQEIL